MGMDAEEMEFLPLSPIAHSWDMEMIKTVLPFSVSDNVLPAQACVYLQPSSEFGKSVAVSTISEAVATGVAISPQESRSVSRVLLASLNSIY